MMPWPGAAPLGVVVDACTALLLVLLFDRLGRVDRHRPLLRTWQWAWIVRVAALVAPVVAAVGALGGGAVDVRRSLGLLALPGTLLFLCFVRFGALQAVGRRPSSAATRMLGVIAVATGGVAAFVDRPALTGTLLVAGFALVCFGAPWAIAYEDRRHSARRTALLIALVLLGIAGCLLALVTCFPGVARSLEPLSGTFVFLSPYIDALLISNIGAAIVLLVVGDAARGAAHVAAERKRQLEEAEQRIARLIAERDGAMARARRQPVEPESAPRPPAIEAARPLPMAPQPASPAAAPPQAPLSLRAPPIESRLATLPPPPVRDDGAPAVVLVIGEDAAERSSLARIFQRGAWTVREAATGEEALSSLLGVTSAEAPLLVVCDLRMAGIGGRGLYEHLQHDRPELLSRLILVVDGHAAGSEGSFLEASRCEVIERPFTVGHVGGAVARVLESS